MEFTENQEFHLSVIHREEDSLVCNLPRIRFSVSPVCTVPKIRLSAYFAPAVGSCGRRN